MSTTTKTLIRTPSKIEFLPVERVGQIEQHLDPLRSFGMRVARQML